MRKQTIAALALELNYSDSRILSRLLLDFIRSSGVSRREFANLDRNTIDGHAASFVRKSGRRYWGTSGRYPSLPEHESFIVRTIADILVVQQKNTVDSLKALERRRRDISTEEPDEYNDEEPESEYGESSNLNISEAAVAAGLALEQAVVPSHTGQDSTPPLLLSEMPEISAGNRGHTACEHSLADRVNGDGTARASSRASILLHVKSPQTAHEPAKTPGPDMVLRSHKRDHNTMENDPVGSVTAHLSVGDGAGPAAKQRRTAIDLVDSVVDVDGSSDKGGTPGTMSRLSKPANVFSFSSINTTFSYEPVPEKESEPPTRVEMLEATTQTEEKLYFKNGWTQYSFDCKNLKPMLHRILDRFDEAEFVLRKCKHDTTSIKVTRRTEAQSEMLQTLQSGLWKDLRSLGAVSVD